MPTSYLVKPMRVWQSCCQRMLLKFYKAPVSSSLRKYTSRTDEQLHELLFVLCQRRQFITGDQLSRTSFFKGYHSLGPLGIELKKNLMTQWWNSMVLHREQILPIDTLCNLPKESSTTEKSVATICSESLQQLLQNDNLTKDQLLSLLKSTMKAHGILRRDLLYGALDQYIPCLELMNRKLPFGLAEIGKCFHMNSDKQDSGQLRTGERTMASLTWFSSARTSGQWRDYWLRHRLLWWQKFAQGTSGFSCIDQQDNQGKKVSLINYQFPWGKEPIESLYNMDESVLLQMHSGNNSKLHGRDGRKAVMPHILWVSGDLDLGILAYLSDALHLMESPAPRSKDRQREVLKLHPILAPIKVAVVIGKGPATDLRLVGQGLSKELCENGISVWPGYLDTLHIPLEQLFTKYDEMGILFTVLVSDSTLENGLLQLRSRDTTLKETMHVSKVKDFLEKYIVASQKL